MGESMRSQRLTLIIFIGMLLGIAVGYACHELWPDPQTAKTIAGYISLFTDIFLRLIKMIIAPLVFTTLVVGVAHMGDIKSVGRIVHGAPATTNIAFGGDDWKTLYFTSRNHLGAVNVKIPGIPVPVAKNSS